MLVRYFMTRDVFTLAPDLTCEAALEEFRRRRIRRAPVLDSQRLIGMVSERDLLSFLPGTIGLASTEAGETNQDTPVRQIMTEEVVSVRSNDHLERAAQLMLKQRVGGLPVMDGNRLSGLITESDIFRALWGVLSSGAGSRIVIEERPDEEKGDLTDFVALCARRDCKIHSLLRHPLEHGVVSSYLRVEGRKIDALIDDLWKQGEKVLVAERVE